jgi:D-glycero-alpha-D-manno-heptose 1-phosphate guanylyltransferase
VSARGRSEALMNRSAQREGSSMHNTAQSVCIVLAGGLGTRLRPVLSDRPKCLAPVGNRTFLALQLEMLAARGVGRFVLALGHLAPMVQQAIVPLQAQLRIDTVTEPEPLGTGGAILYAMHHADIDECMVTNGDTWLDADLSALMTPLDSGEKLRMGCIVVADRSRYGGVAFEGSGLVAGFLPKGAEGSGPINAGFYRVQRSAFSGWSVGAKFSLELDVLPGLVAAGAVRATPLDGTFIDIGVPDDYQRFGERYT